ncbi:MAG: DUF3570 domain-containing protein, partial [Gammaproteobacteria bacterium]|nr:DUF3570 domain-containing protein [Gammaproteobacteria bacterium]
EDRSRTWSLGGSYTTDSITGTDSLDGVGGLPMPLTNAANKLRQSASDDKQAKEFKIGLTQVINAKSLVQLSYTKNISTGYHNDPYKLVSLVDSNGISTASLYESRPDSRDRNVFFGEYTLFVDGDVLKLDYRFFNDDWGINSNTFGVKYRWAQSENLYIEPHFRYYTQSAADFHQFYLEDSSPVPTNISSDSRLSAFNSTTLGVKVGYNFANYEISGRIEKMQQKTNESFSDAPGQLSGYDLFAPINALIAQVNFSVKF